MSPCAGTLPVISAPQILQIVLVWRGAGVGSGVGSGVGTGAGCTGDVGAGAGGSVCSGAGSTVGAGVDAGLGVDVLSGRGVADAGAGVSGASFASLPPMPPGDPLPASGDGVLSVAGVDMGAGVEVQAVGAEDGERAAVGASSVSVDGAAGETVSRAPPSCAEHPATANTITKSSNHTAATVLFLFMAKPPVQLTFLSVVVC